jgi:hypothetical protein
MAQTRLPQASTHAKARSGGRHRSWERWGRSSRCNSIELPDPCRRLLRRAMTRHDKRRQSLVRLSSLLALQQHTSTVAKGELKHIVPLLVFQGQPIGEPMDQLVQLLVLSLQSPLPGERMPCTCRVPYLLGQVFCRDWLVFGQVKYQHMSVKSHMQLPPSSPTDGCPQRR